MPITSALMLAAAAQFSLAGSEVVDLPHAANDVAYQLYIQIDPQCRRDEVRCPVVYTLDAEYSFALTATISTHLSERRGMRPVIVVSVGYRDKSAYRPNRTRDYTPWPVDAQGSDPNYHGSGQAAQFRMVLREDVIPLVEARYHASTSERILVGHSYGGLFAVDTLVNQPGLFSGYLIVSPSLWYADGRPIESLRAFAASTPAKRARVYLAVGELEEQPSAGRPMVSQAREAARLLEGMKPSITLSGFDVLPGETHASVFPAALSNGLRRMLPPVSP